jgi:Tfp pilus assembly protein PilF
MASACASHRPPAPATPIAASDPVAATSQAYRDLEAWDHSLGAALADMRRTPSARAAERVGHEYLRLRVHDAAYVHFTKAIALDRRSATAYDGRARVLRDVNMPGLGLADAYRAVFLAPESAAAVNTLGTLLESLGNLKEARARYLQARGLSPAAQFPRTNLCHIETLLGVRTAVASCREALQGNEQSVGNRQNLAIAYATTGDFEAARHELSQAGDQVTANYNMGVIFMSARQFDRAAESFRRALLAAPGATPADARLLQLAARPEK